MSSGKSENKFLEITNNLYDHILNQNMNISRVVIPFSKVFKSYKPIDVYSGKEKIPFRERNFEYKRILKEEFAKNTTL